MQTTSLNLYFIVIISSTLWLYTLQMLNCSFCQMPSIQRLYSVWQNLKAIWRSHSGGKWWRCEGYDYFLFTVLYFLYVQLLNAHIVAAGLTELCVIRLVCVCEKDSVHYTQWVGYSYFFFTVAFWTERHCYSSSFSLFFSLSLNYLFIIRSVRNCLQLRTQFF